MNAGREKERSVFWSMVLHLLLLVPDAAAVLLSGSVTMLADVLKSFNELIAAFLAWLTLRKLARGGGVHYDYGMGKLENLAGVGTAVVLGLSLAIVLYHAVEKLIHPSALHEGGALFAMVMMGLGVVSNLWLWRKNWLVAQKEHSPVMESQWRMFMSKAAADGFVLLSLLAGVVFEDRPWAWYIDPVASFVIAGFLLFSIYGIITSTVHDLLDRTLEESVQLEIIKALTVFFNDYRQIHGVRSRRSGGNVYIELFLEFDPDLRMGQVQDIIERMRTALQLRIRGSCVVVVPATGPVALSRPAQGSPAT